MSVMAGGHEHQGRWLQSRCIHTGEVSQRRTNKYSKGVQVNVTVPIASFTLGTCFSPLQPSLTSAAFQQLSSGCLTAEMADLEVGSFLLQVQVSPLLCTLGLHNAARLGLVTHRLPLLALFFSSAHMLLLHYLLGQQSPLLLLQYPLTA